MKKRRTSRVLSLALAVSLVLSLACLPASAEGFVGKDDIFDFVCTCSQGLCENPLFVLVNCYTTGLQPAVIKNILSIALKDRSARTDAYELGLPTDEGICLPCGASGLAAF